jgi:integrase
MPKKGTLTFSTKQEARLLPPPETGYYAKYPHITQPGFFVRVSKVKADGKIERLYMHRYDLVERDEAGNIKEREKVDDLGPVEAGRLEDVLRQVLETRHAQEKMRKQGGQETQLTVEGAWAYYATVKQLNKDLTADKDEKVFQRYFAHLGKRFLDDLPFPFWATFIKELREGTLVVGEKPREDDPRKGMQPELRGPLSEATLIGVMNIAVMLFNIGNKYKGLRELKGTNPAAEAKKELVGAPNEKTRHIPLKDLGKAMRAAQQLISPWWRDLFYTFVLTGLRRSLVFDMRFDEIDFKNGVYVIHPLKKGTKRLKKNVTESTPPLRIPLSAFMLEMIEAKREFAPDRDGLVWHTPKPTRGRRVKNDKQALSDPRGAWTLIEGAIGDLHFSPHDIRRTFATAGMACGADVFAVAMLMLHSGAGLAQVTQVPGITIKYMNTDEAVERMRRTAQQISDYVGHLIAMPEQEASNLEDPALPPMLENLLGQAA